MAKKTETKEKGYSPAGIDANSIETTTLLSFVIFAGLLVFIVWLLTSFFVDTYYSSLRSQETVRVARGLEAQYVDNPAGFDEFAAQTARTIR